MYNAVLCSVFKFDHLSPYCPNYHLDFKGGRAFRGNFCPPMRPKNENCFSEVSSD